MSQLYRHFNKEGQLLYVGISYSAVHRLSQHKDHSHWYATISNVTIESFPDRKAALAAETKAIHKENPLHNIQRPNPKVEKLTNYNIENSKKELTHRIVQFNATYSRAQLGIALGVSIVKVKMLWDGRELGFYYDDRGRQRSTGWQLIEYLDYLSASNPAEKR